MKNKHFLFLAFMVFCAGCSFSQHVDKKKITLEKSCSFKNRKVVDSLKNQVAELLWRNDLYIITIKNRKYIACNLPVGIQNKSIMVSGDVLEIFPTERLMGTPLRVTEANYK
jgi:hypothetical protein